MKIKIYLFVFVILCFQACHSDDPLEMENPEMETETETPHELEGVWKLVDFNGDMSERVNGSKIDYNIYIIDPQERSLNIEQDSFCFVGDFTDRYITIKNGDTTHIGAITHGGYTMIDGTSICRNYSYTVSNDMLISQYKGLFGMSFPSPNSDFSINKDDTQSSTFIIEDDKLIITTSEVDNPAENYEGESLVYEFTSTWIKS